MNDQRTFDINKILHWNKWHTRLILLFSCISLYTHSLVFIGIVASVSFSTYIYIFRFELGQYSPFSGYANIVTLFRATMLIFTMFFWRELTYNQLFFILLTVTILDWLDGLIAKKFDLKSDFGLYLDMETDALLVATMSFILWNQSNFHWIILIAGFLRYAYSFVLLILSDGGVKEPKRSYASIIAGLFYISLLLNFIYNSEISRYLLYFVSLAIMFSFGRSFHFQITGIFKKTIS